MADKPKILITGFGHFPGAPENPTKRLVEMITHDGLTPSDDIDVTALVLPTEYHFVDQYVAGLFDRHEPDIALHFGLDETATGFVLEQYARNHSNTARSDAAGTMPESPVIDPNGPARLVTGLPLGEIEQALKDINLPVILSENAGRYVCNYLFYRTRQLALSGECQMSGFIHVPLLDTQTEDEKLTTLTQDQLLAGVRSCVVACVKNWRINMASV